MQGAANLEVPSTLQCRKATPRSSTYFSNEVNVRVGKKCSGPLQAAAAGGYTNMLLLLIEAGADIHKRGGKFCTVLQAACLHGKLRNVKILVDCGADMNVIGGYYGSAIQAAVICRHAEVVRYLLEKGVSLNQVDRKLFSHISASVLDAAGAMLIGVKEAPAGEDEPEGRKSNEYESDWQSFGGKRGFQNMPQKPTRWDVVRGMSLPVLSKKVILAEVTAPDYLGEVMKEVAEPMPLTGVKGNVMMRRPGGDDLPARMTVHHAPKSLPIVPKHELVDDSPDVEWDVLTCLPAGEIAPVHSW